MNLEEAILDLRIEREKLGWIIIALEERQRTDQSMPLSHLGGERRGRKSMGAKEQQEVSERMTRYWASRRKRQKEELGSVK
jgi:hypothetical protein